MAADARYQFDTRRVQGAAHSGDWCEQISLRADNGSFVYAGHAIEPARVIAELKPSVWVKSNRTGINLLARIVLPHTLHPRTAKPATVLVPGTQYTSSGQWQQLRIDDLPDQLGRSVRVLQAEFGREQTVVTREAYVDEVLLNVYGGQGETYVLVDDLELPGLVSSQAIVPASLTRQSGDPLGPAVGGLTRDVPTIKFSGSLLLVNGVPTFVRAIEHRGESLRWLRQLGFNAVLIDEAASATVLREAAREGMFVICPPPQSNDGSHRPLPLGAGMADVYEPVLAWLMGRGLQQEDWPRVRALAEQTRMADRSRNRPLLCGADEQLADFSRHVDLMLADRRPLGSTLDLTAYAGWLAQQPRLAEPGTPLWAVIQTETSPALLRQWQALSGAPHVAAAIAPEQVRLLVYTALATGVRGLVFQSQTRLDENTSAARSRLLTLQMLNLELDLISRWLGGGRRLADVASNVENVHAAVLESGRSRLLLPTWTGSHAQLVAGQAAAHNVAFTVPGIPEANDVFELTPVGLIPLRRQRVAGGIQVVLNEFGLTSCIVATKDARTISSLRQQIAAVRQRAAELARETAHASRVEVETVVRRLEPWHPAPRQGAQWLASAGDQLARCDQRLAAGDFRGSYQTSQRAMRPLRLLQREYWEQLVMGLRPPLASPYAANWTTLPQHAALLAKLVQQRLGPNRLPSGEFEDLDAMISAGWRHVSRGNDQIHTQAELARAGAHSGEGALRLIVEAASESSPAALESPPVWITSAPVSFEPGQLVRIHGWVQIPRRITGSVDGLLVIDSVGGYDLALRLGQTTGWQEFSMYRAISSREPLTVSLVLSGYGEALVDGLSIQPLE